ncbi:threonine aldolase family protein [Salininema proteolyticum]|uniref:Threonine aldolase family protein n=1 Tax=Salininema proteolyticum TaxID=1607685 RepID=A0ABV8U204_9ACTN
MQVDLRSDTVTRPNPEMLGAMSHAEVGDDVFGDDPTVNELERRVAELFGFDAAVFTPTGSMANQIALQLSASPGEEILAETRAHVVNNEVGALAAYGGVSSRTFWSEGGRVNAEEVASLVNGPGAYATPTAVIAVENTHNAAGGTVQQLGEVERLGRLAHERGVALHMDGARIWNARAATNIGFRKWAEPVDTLSVCLSKGLGAPAGSLVLCSAEKEARARTVRKRMGGTMRQSGYLAAAGLYALDHNLARLWQDHARARFLADELAAYGVCEPEEVETNILMLTGEGMDRIAAQAEERGVRFLAFSATRARLITHLDVDDAGIEYTAKVLSELLR